ncbi:hypothetical protein QZH41_007801 [Actinostola sp. cb2023]|nr:hypothetical protein QZH41_007801 [Actinostola sp. cb2023]
MEHDCSDDDVTTSQIGPRKKKKRLSAFELSEIIVQKGIKTRLQLLVLADEQKKEGKTDVAEFIVNRGSKIVSEVLNTAWEMKQSRETLERRSKTRLELLYEARDGDCELGCNGQWLECALQLLNNNAIDVSKFQQSVGLLLDKGRGKYRNIMIIGPCDTGKTFILNPLTRIYNTFSNPASSTFAWVGADEAECIFLNDFRWSSTLIQWHDFLLMLEGQPVHLPAPKSHYAKDLVLEEDTPIFATGKRPLVYMKNGVVDERETDMMSAIVSHIQASSTFAWVGADEAECIFLNDFRWSSTLIQWHDFLLMLEGQPVHLPAPKSHYAKDLVLEEDTPIFATGKRPLVYMKNGVVDERETDMMSNGNHFAFFVP